MCGGGGSKKAAPAPVPIVQNPDENTYRGGPDRMAPPVPPITDQGTTFGSSLGKGG